MLESYLSPAQVAECLNVHRETVLRMARRGELPKPIRIGGQTLRWKESEIAAFLEDRRASDLEG